MAEKRLKEIRAEVTEYVDKYNDLVMSGKAKAKDLAELEEKIKKGVSDYTSVKENDVFLECKATENPMLEAVKRLTFQTIAVKDEKSEDGDGVVLKNIDTRDRDIDLKKLHTKCGSIGANPSWIYILEKFNCLLTMKAADDLGLDPKEVNDSYAMDKLAREVEMGKNPTSNNNIVKTLQMVVSAMIGEEYKATSHDVKYIEKVYTRKSREALKVTCGNHKQLRGILAQVCHKLVLGKSYAIDYKKIQ